MPDFNPASPASMTPSSGGGAPAPSPATSPSPSQPASSSPSHADSMSSTSLSSAGEAGSEISGHPHWYKPDGVESAASQDQQPGAKDQPQESQDGKPGEADAKLTSELASHQSFTFDYVYPTEMENMPRDRAVEYEFTQLLNQHRADPQASFNGLLKLHHEQMQRLHQENFAYQRRVWDQTTLDWKNELRNDPTIGGPRLARSLSEAKSLVEMFAHGGRVADTLKLLDLTGVANSALLVGLFSNLARQLNVFEDGMVTSNPSPPRGNQGGGRGWYK